MTQHTLESPLAGSAHDDLPLPPLAPGRWPMGHLRELNQDPLGTFEELRREYGSIVRFRAGTLTLNLIAEPDAVQQVLQRNANNYDKRVFAYQRLKPLLGEGIITSDGDAWLGMRRTALPAFQRQQIDRVVPACVRAAEEVALRWKLADQEGEAVDVRADAGSIAMRTVSSVLLGADVSDQAERLADALTPVLQELNRRLYSPLVPPAWLPSPGNRRLTRSIRDLDRIILAIIEQARKTPQRDGLIDRLIEQATEGEGDPLERLKHLRDEVANYLLAGFETTASAIAYTLVCLARHPGAAARVRAELEQVLGVRTPEPADLANLRYTRMVIDESLRLLPPVWVFDRRAIDDDVLGGYLFSKNSIALISPWILHRDPDLWPEPLRFRPERFEAAEARHRHPFAYVPFAGGPRGCLGQRFALTETLSALAVLCARFRPGHAPVPFELDPCITLRPAGPLMIRMRRLPQRRAREPQREELVQELFALLTPGLKARPWAGCRADVQRLPAPHPSEPDA